MIQEDYVKRLLPRYEQISALNNNHYIFAIETNPKAFHNDNREQKYNRENSLLGNQSLMDNSQNDSNNYWNEKKGANELSKKLKPGFIQVILNMEHLSLGKDEKGERMFPRLSYLQLNESLIQAHLDILE